MSDKIDVKIVANIYKISDLPIEKFNDFIKFLRKFGYRLGNDGKGNIIEDAEDNCIHVYVQIPGDGFKVFLKRFRTAPWLSGKPPIKAISLSQMKARKGKFRAIVILDSEPYQIAEDVDTSGEAERLCRYYENDMQPVQIYNHHGLIQ